MYLPMKALHILAVVLFLGNIITAGSWPRHAERTRDPKLLAHTVAGLIRSDRLFTMPGVLAIIASGVIAAIAAGFPILGTPWILWTLVLFGISGACFGMRVAPLQRQLLALAQAGASGGAFDFAAYRRLAVSWEIWGAVATIAPLIGLAFMVLKPAL